MPGQHLSRHELAELVNAWIFENRRRTVDVSANYIAKLERGVIHWPGADYRAALRAALGARSDLDLGFVPSRSPAQDGAAREQAPARASVLSTAALMTMGAGHDAATSWAQPVVEEETPLPARLGIADIEQVEGVTSGLRALDYRYGGGACRDAVIAQARRGENLLQLRIQPAVRRRLLLALADLHNLAGWAAFDLGLNDTAVRHFQRALEQARHVEAHSLVANLLYRLGRVDLHRGFADSALRFFQLGQLVAQDAGCELTVSMLCANEAWSYAMLGDAVQARKSLNRALDEFSRSDPVDAAPWIRFFNLADIEALTGVVYTELAKHDPTFAGIAIDNLDHGLASRGTDMTRSQAFELTALATAHIRDGNLERGAAIGGRAADVIEKIRSVRAVDRLRPLHHEAERRRRHPEMKELAERLAMLRSP